MGVSTPMVTARTPRSGVNSPMPQVIKPVSVSPAGELCKALGAEARSGDAARTIAAPGKRSARDASEASELIYY